MKIDLIEWIDSYGCNGAWTEVDDKPLELFSCYSCGFVIKESESAIVISGHYHPSRKSIGAVMSVSGDITIPKVAIISRVPLGEQECKDC